MLSCAISTGIGASRDKMEFHGADTDTDTDIIARILADTSDTGD